MGVTPYVNFHLHYRSYLLWASQIRSLCLIRLSSLAAVRSFHVQKHDINETFLKNHHNSEQYIFQSLWQKKNNPDFILQTSELKFKHNGK